ncbi:MAG: DUF1858 domain-containing protein [Candidatus Kapabacteria bacterium]|nr:DUF1858 domain-containing protein [Candidatus Kapabacteria bacterium]
MENKNYIIPHMKVSELLDAYPQLEETLIQLAPEFKKLKNPILRKTIAKVATLEQAARVGGIPIEKMINTLRAEAGQESEFDQIKPAEAIPQVNEKFDRTKIIRTFDAREIIAAGGHPLGDFMREVNKIITGDIYEFITPFYPAPLIDKATDAGFECHTDKISAEEYRHYFWRK